MPAIITRDDAQYALDLVTKICTEVGPGLPASPQERARAEMIKNELQTHLGEGNVVLEEFTLAPKGFQGVLRGSAVFTLIAVLLNISIGRFTGVSPWLTASVSLVFAICSVLPVFFNTILYRELVDPILKQGRSVNVIGKLCKPGTKNVKQLLILSGHHDSALEFTWLRLLNDLRRLFFPSGRQDSARENAWLSFLGSLFLVITVTMFLGGVVMLVFSLIQMTGLITGNAGIIRFGTLGWVVLVYPILPSIIIGLSYTRGWKNGGNVPGAADNLSASVLAVAMCRFLVKNPDTIPDETEIRFISFGSEEAGLRGSRRYVARHLEELQRLDARLLNYEVVAYPEISILATDVTGVKNSPEMVKSVVAAAERARVPYTLKANPTSGGGSDAGSFSQAGLKALTLMPMHMPHQMVAFYHQKWDGPEVLTIEPLLNVLKLTFEWIRS
jgi:Peptidase family M28